MTRRRFSHSLSGRLILIFFGMGVLFLVLVGSSIGHTIHAQFRDQVRPHLMQYLNYVQADIGLPPDYARAAELGRRLPVIIQINGPDGVWVSQGTPIDFRDLTENHRSRQGDKEYVYGELRGREYLLVRDRSYSYGFSVPRERSAWRIFIPLGILLLILMLLYHFTRRLFSPIATIKDGVERIGRGELDHRINVCRCDELGALGESINAMAADVKRMLDSKRQLLLAISHELRSPLTRAKVAMNLVDDDIARYEVERELNELEKLIEELLETERLATRHQALNKQPVNMGELVQETIETLRVDPLPRFHVPPAPILADIDPVRFKLLVRNLAENAARHTPENAPPPEVSLGANEEVIELVVRDYGPGIAPEHLPHVTEPFYRVDPARRRETGGYGLGLYLCRRIAEAHGGELIIRSNEKDGTEIRVSLPQAWV